MYPQSSANRMPYPQSSSAQQVKLTRHIMYSKIYCTITGSLTYDGPGITITNILHEFGGEEYYPKKETGFNSLTSTSGFSQIMKELLPSSINLYHAAMMKKYANHLKEALYRSPILPKWAKLLIIQWLTKAHNISYRLKLMYKGALYPLILLINKINEPDIDRSKSKRTVKILDCNGRSNIKTFKKNFNTKTGWGDLDFTNQKYADYYLVINNALHSPFSYYNPKRTLLYYAEPAASVKRWGPWSKPDERNEFFHVSRLPHGRIFTVWYLSRSYHWLKENSIQKAKVLSTITSDQNIFPLHKERLKFVKILDEQISIDIYGRSNRSNSQLKTFSQYRGALLPDLCKDDGLFPYKYHVASENSIEDNYFTEKLTDAILAECLCFYHGTETAGNWIDNRAFIHIDIAKPIEAIKLIKQAIENNEWEKRIQIIRKEKQKILDEMNLLADIERVIKSKDNFISQSDHSTSLPDTKGSADS